jgi:hypothetical protein
MPLGEEINEQMGTYGTWLNTQYEKFLERKEKQQKQKGNVDEISKNMIKSLNLQDAEMIINDWISNSQAIKEKEEEKLKIVNAIFYLEKKGKDVQEKLQLFPSVNNQRLNKPSTEEKLPLSTLVNENMRVTNIVPMIVSFDEDDLSYEMNKNQVTEQKKSPTTTTATMMISDRPTLSTMITRDLLPNLCAYYYDKMTNNKEMDTKSISCNLVPAVLITIKSLKLMDHVQQQLSSEEIIIETTTSQKASSLGKGFQLSAKGNLYDLSTTSFPELPFQSFFQSFFSSSKSSSKDEATQINNKYEDISENNDLLQTKLGIQIIHIDQTSLLVKFQDKQVGRFNKLEDFDISYMLYKVEFNSAS